MVSKEELRLEIKAKKDVVNELKETITKLETEIMHLKSDNSRLIDAVACLADRV